MNAIWEAEKICTPQGVPYVHQLYGFPVSPGSSRLNNWVPLQPLLPVSLLELEESKSVQESENFVSFNVTLTPADPNSTVQVDYSTQDGSAVAGVHYVATSGTLVFPPNQTLQVITIPLLGADISEVVEFLVSLTNPQGANLGNSLSSVIIIPDAGST